MNNAIVFQVETTRILTILTSEIYNSPLALIRENLQNAYDAVRMRFAPSGTLTQGGQIDIRVGGGEISIADNGIGMSEAVLRENFWKAGSSGKHSESARRAGVVGTFGIGAMANFGVCSRLTVETRAEGSMEVLRSVADRASLEIAKECISLERSSSARDVGTTVTAVLDNEHPISPEQAARYLEPYVGMLPVPVYLNNTLISGKTIKSRLPIAGRQFTHLGAQALRQSDNLCGGTFDVRTDPNGQILIHVTKITLGGNAIEGEMALLQSGGQLMGLRSYFGLAPIPAMGPYQLGGIANLSFLQPTAGREALSRESIDQVSRLVNLAEWAASKALAESPLADKNNAFLRWIISQNRFELASKVEIRVLPDNKDVPMGDVKSYAGTRALRYYTGSDRHIITTFSSEGTCLLLVVQGNPRRNVQLTYLNQILKIPQIPESVQITYKYSASEITSKEVSVLLRIASILRGDYLITDAEPILADISHNVAVFPEKSGDRLKIYVAR